MKGRNSIMENNIAVSPRSRGEQETETAATRLIELVEDALAVVAIRSTAEVDSLEAGADRIERAARDLSVALRELAHERHIAQNAVE
jgi:hypothetical protein